MNTKTNLLDGIIIFSEVVKSGSFTKAAHNTGHSTSYISKEINKLEERLGVRLLHRTTRTLSLTPEGESYYAQSVQIIDDALNAELCVAGQQGEPQGMLRVSCPVSFGTANLAPVLAKFTQAYPKIELELELNDRMVDVVSEGFDIVIRASKKLEDSSLVSRFIMESYGVTVATPEYLKAYGHPRSPCELTEHKVINYSLAKQPDIWEYINLDGEPISVRVKSCVKTNSPELERALCVASQGITRIPISHVEADLQNGTLVELFADYPRLRLDLHMVYPSRKHVSAKVRSFIDFVLSEFEN